MNDTGTQIQVMKLKSSGEVDWSYTGRLIEKNATALLLEAPFNRPDTPFEEILIRQGDLFLELYFSERWYNIYAILDRDSRVLKAWYCNLSRPAAWTDGRLEFVDLALDLIVYPDGRQKVLDLEDYNRLELDCGARRQVQLSLAELQALFAATPGGVFPPGLNSGLSLETGGWNFPTTP